MADIPRVPPVPEPQVVTDTATVVADGVVSSQTVTTSTGPVSQEPSRLFPYALAALIVAGFFVVLGLLVFVPVPPEAVTVLNVTLGTLNAAVMTVISYYFGSSAGSARKTELIKEGK